MDRHTPLIAARDFAERLLESDCVAIDCRFDLTAPHAGFHAYLRGHVPGARYAHLDKDLARAPSALEGRHPLPDPDALAACLGAWGVSNGTFVVAYDEGPGAVAARLWWLLRWLGHERVAVLDGGVAAWKHEGLPVETRIPAWASCRFEARVAHADWVVASDDLPALQAHGAVVLDARAPARFRGESEPIDPVAGHVPGAVNLPFAALVGADQRFKSPAELRAAFASRVAERAEAPNVIAMCGSGVTACHLLLGLEAAGLPAGRLYAGSWSEWIRDPARAVATGD